MGGGDRVADCGGKDVVRGDGRRVGGQLGGQLERRQPNDASASCSSFATGAGARALLLVRKISTPPVGCSCSRPGVTSWTRTRRATIFFLRSIPHQFPHRKKTNKTKNQKKRSRGERGQRFDPFFVFNTSFLLRSNSRAAVRVRVCLCFPTVPGIRGHLFGSS